MPLRVTTSTLRSAHSSVRIGNRTRGGHASHSVGKGSTILTETVELPALHGLAPLSSDLHEETTLVLLRTFLVGLLCLLHGIGQREFRVALHGRLEVCHPSVRHFDSQRDYIVAV